MKRILPISAVLLLSLPVHANERQAAGVQECESDASGSKLEDSIRSYEKINVQIREGKFNDAETELWHLILKDSTDADAWLKPGQVCVQLGKRDGIALRQSRALREQTNTEQRALKVKRLLALTDLVVQRGDLDLALKLLEEAHRLAPDRDDLGMRYFDILFRRHSEEQKRQELKERRDLDIPFG